MPVSIVKNKIDEKIWERAKEIAKAQGQEDNYAFITGIFEKIKSAKEKNNSEEFSLDWTEEDNDEVIEELMQQVFPSPGGKYRVAKRFASWFPQHKTYVEPFAGGLACYFNKEPSPVEVVNDLDLDIAGAYKFVRDCSDEDIAKLKRMKWDADKEYFHKLRKADYSNNSDSDKFYRYMYLIKASYGGNRSSFGYKNINTHFLERIPQLKERLKNTHIYNENYLDVLKKYDAEDAFFYLDPPYPDEWPGPESKKTKLWGEQEVKEFVQYLTQCKAKFMVSLNNLEWIRKLFEGHGWQVMTTPVPRTFRLGMKAKYELLVTNYKIEGAPKEHLKVADNEIIVNSEMKQLAESYYSGKYEVGSTEFVDVIMGSLEDYDIVLRKKDSSKEYHLSSIESSEKTFDKNIVEKLPKGEHIMVYKKNGNIMAKTKEGKLFDVQNELKKDMSSDPRDFIIEAFSLTEEENQIVKQTIYATDIFYLNEDLSSKPAIERKKFLKTLSFSSKFKLNPFVVVDNEQVGKAAQLFSKSLNSSGCLIQDYFGGINSLAVVKNGN